MKLFLFVILSVWLQWGYAGGRSFPGVEYSYVKVYLFNLNNEQGERPESFVVEGNYYAASKIDNGYSLSEEKVERLNRVLSGDINVLRIGLSKCFIPRHGVVYFNENHEAVASVSICFECGMVKLWSPDVKFPPLNYKKVDEGKAEKQLEYIRSQVFGENIPYFENPKEYLTIVDDWNRENYDNAMETELEGQDSVFTKITQESLRLWFRNPAQVKEEKEEKVTAGGSRYQFKTWKYKKSDFLFWDASEKASLASASIVDPEIVLPNGMSIGMSSEQVLRHYNYFEKDNIPTILFVKEGSGTIEYHFIYNTLNLIKLNFNQ